MMAAVVMLSCDTWLWKMWTKPRLSIQVSVLWNAIVMCHGKPRFPNQSLWSSLYFRGRYFMDQSQIKSTSLCCIVSKRSDFAASWFLHRMRWRFKFVILCVAFWSLNCKSRSESVSPWLHEHWIVFIKEEIASFICSHVTQTRSWWCWQVTANSGWSGSLRAKVWQWSATLLSGEMCT